MDRESRETWAKRVERWKDSGLTAKEYAAEVGINAGSLSWWRWRLSSKAAAAPASRASARRRHEAKTVGSSEPVTFLELPSAIAAEPFEVVLPSSLRVRVPPSFDATSLRRLLDVLAPRP